MMLTMIMMLTSSLMIGAASNLRERPESLHHVVPGVSSSHHLNPNLAIVGEHISDPEIISEDELDQLNNVSTHIGFNQTDLSHHLKDYLDKHATESADTPEADDDGYGDEEDRSDEEEVDATDDTDEQSDNAESDDTDEQSNAEQVDDTEEETGDISESEGNDETPKDVTADAKKLVSIADMTEKTAESDEKEVESAAVDSESASDTGGGPGAPGKLQKLERERAELQGEMDLVKSKIENVKNALAVDSATGAGEEAEGESASTGTANSDETADTDDNEEDTDEAEDDSDETNPDTGKNAEDTDEDGDEEEDDSEGISK